MQELNEAPNEMMVHPEVLKEIEALPPEYRNYKEEFQNRKIQFYDTKKNGTLKYQRVPMCGHKFVPGKEPRHRNCEPCWFSFFQVHGELTQSVEEVYQKLGSDAVKKLRGPKFLDNFLKFMSTVAAYQEAAKVAKVKQEQENNGSIGRAEGSNEASGKDLGEGEDASLDGEVDGKYYGDFD